MEAKGKAAWKPAYSPRQHRATAALKAYALLATTADQGEVRNVKALR